MSTENQEAQEETPVHAVKMILDANDLGMTTEEITEFSALTDTGEIERAKSHRKKMMAAGLKPIRPGEWLECPLCAQQIAADGVNEFGASIPYRTPESMVNHYTQHGGVTEVASRLGIMPEQLTIVHPRLQDELRIKGADNQPKTLIKTA